MDWERDVHEAVEIWQSKSGDLWGVEFQLVELDGRAECVGVRVSSFSDDSTAAPRPLLAQTLKELPMASVLAKARRGTADLEVEWAAAIVAISHRQGEKAPPGRPRVTVSPEAAQVISSASEREARFLAPADGQKSGRRARHTRAELERVALIYAAAHKYGDGRGTKSAPTKAVAETLGLSHNQAAKLVQRCRKVGLLGGTEKGIAGGVLSPADTTTEDTP